MRIHPLRMLLLSILVVMGVGALVSGCSTMKTLAGSPIIDVSVVNLAVAAAVGTNKATAQPRAQKIKDIAVLLLADSTALTSLPTLENDVNAQIVKLNLPAPDLMLAQALTSALAISAQAYLATSGKAVEVQAATVAISAVLNQVITEAKAFGAV